jgi:hypothetical protein
VTGLREQGWYDDPGGDLRQLRWWDGTDWTAITRLRLPHEVPVTPPRPLPAFSGGEVLDAADYPRRRWAWPAVLGIIGLIAVLVLTGALPGLDTGTRQPRPVSGPVAEPRLPFPTDLPTPAFPTPSPQPTGPVTGRITDNAARISYDVLPGSWQAWNMFIFDGLLSTAGYFRVVQKETPDGSPYWANVTSGIASPAVASPNDLTATARRLAHNLDEQYYPPHTSKGQTERALTVDGHQAYLSQFVAQFDPAATKGYTSKSEQVTVLVIDTGKTLPAVLYISLPDQVKPLWSSVGALVASVRVLR